MCFYMRGSVLGNEEKMENALNLIRSSEPAKRRAGLRELGELRDPDAVSIAIEALDDTDPGVRTEAVDTLGSMRNREAVEPLIELLDDPNRGVRINTVVALGFLGDSRAVPGVIKRLKEDDNEGVRISAADVLGRLDDERAIEPLVEVIESPQEARIRAQAVRSLGRLKAVEASQVVARRALDKEEDFRVRIYSAEALGDLNTDESESALKKLLDSENLELAITASGALGKHGNNKGLDKALKGMRSEASKIRRRAIEAIGDIGEKTPEVEQVVKEALSDSDSRVVSRARFVAASLNIDIEEE
ncbi:MAG: HEAT repeat domain-containing protein [Elusimicrobiota bacterium]